jgi:hypothetical protein
MSKRASFFGGLAQLKESAVFLIVLHLLSRGMLTEECWLPRRQNVEARRSFFFSVGDTVLQEGERLLIEIPATTLPKPPGKRSRITEEEQKQFQEWVLLVAEQKLKRPQLFGFAQMRGLSLNKGMAKDSILRRLVKAGLSAERYHAQSRSISDSKSGM